MAAAGGEALRKENDGALLGCPWLRARVRQRMRGREKERALSFSTSCTRGELASMQASEGATWPVAHAHDRPSSSSKSTTKIAIPPQKYTETSIFLPS